MPDVVHPDPLPVVVTTNAAKRMAHLTGRSFDLSSMRRLITRLFFVGESFPLEEGRDDKMVLVEPENVWVVLLVIYDKDNAAQPIIRTVITREMAKTIREKGFKHDTARP